MASYAYDGLDSFKVLNNGDVEVLWEVCLPCEDVEEDPTPLNQLDEEECEILAAWYEGDKHYTL